MKGPLRVGVIGAGAWGMALAMTAARAGNDVRVWSRSADVVEGISRQCRHPRVFRDTLFPSSVSATLDYRELAACNVLLVATPAQAIRECMKRMSSHVRAGTPALIAAKGIEIATGKFMTQVVQEVCKGAVPYVLSGPSFATDVVAGKPTAVALAGEDSVATSDLAARLSLPAFRIYTSSDLMGVQLGGAVKNVLAIACGITEGKGLGASARAALTARAFSELMRLGRELGARPETLTGLSGLGDLVLTCSSLQSRNFSFGIALGRGTSATEALAVVHETIEGIPTAQAIDRLAAERKLDVPICRAVSSIISGATGVDEAITTLLSRPLRSEHEAASDPQ